jgi:hypothetical protein
MPTLRSTRWWLAMGPALLLATGCAGSNENNINIKGTSSSPDAAASTDEMLKRGEGKTSKRVVPSGYPRPGGR